MRFFLFLAAFALGIGVIYWFASSELVGTFLLLGFGIATGLLGLRLHVDPGAARVRRMAAGRPPSPVPDVDLPSGGRAGDDRPFVDDTGRFPAATLAPLAIGAGVSLIAVGAIFGVAPAVVGLLPLAWGGWAWLAGASAELDAEAELDADAVPDAEPGVRGEPPR